MFKPVSSVYKNVRMYPHDRDEKQKDEEADRIFAVQGSARVVRRLRRKKGTV